MEPKKIKKLTLSKETIVNLTNPEMGHHKGGASPFFFCDTGLQLTCMLSAAAMGACSCVTGCRECFPSYACPSDGCFPYSIYCDSDFCCYDGSIS